jgi:hypothetical protein
MNKTALEKNLVIFLFIVVLVVFSFAERDSKKMNQMYTASQAVKKDAGLVLVKTTRALNQ